MIKQPRKKIIEIAGTYLPEAYVSKKILDDFINFKETNELLFCTLNTEKINKNTIDVTWTTTVKHPCKITHSGIIHRDFSDFLSENSSEYSQITKITCQENYHVVEYTTYMTYEIRYE